MPTLLYATLPLRSPLYWLRLGLLLLIGVGSEQLHSAYNLEWMITLLTLGFTVLLPSLVVRRAAYTQVAAEAMTLYMLFFFALSFTTNLWQERLVLPAFVLILAYGWLRLQKVGINPVHILWLPLFFGLAAISAVWVDMSLNPRLPM